ncbi:MAG: hypothetical protein D6813_13575 [Calditrichaeota bacterium]|nr:MAG: hypothetical protein D6813_13575 [Calditrichota bacterium]
MNKLHFDFRDLFRSARLAFSLQRLWIQFVGLVVSYAGYFILTLVSFIVSGYRVADVFNQYGLFPCLLIPGVNSNIAGKILFGLGCLFFICGLLVTSTAVARASFMVLKGNNFYTWREAFGFALKKSGSTLVTPLAIALLALSFILGAWFIGLLGRIPFVGELGVSLLTIVWLAAALFLVFLIIVTAISLIIAPAIIATTDEDAFEAVFQSFSTVWNQPWRFVVYEGLIGAVSIVGFFILAFFVKRAFLVMNSLIAFSMADKFQNLAWQAQYYLQSWTQEIAGWIQAVFGKFAPLIFFSRDFIPLQDLTATVNISAYLYAINMLIAGGFVVSFLLATFNTGNMISYLILRKLKDDENLLERKEETFEKIEEKPEEEKKEEKEKVTEEKETTKE